MRKETQEFKAKVAHVCPHRVTRCWLGRVGPAAVPECGLLHEQAWEARAGSHGMWALNKLGQVMPGDAK